MDKQRFWEQVLDEMESRISKPSFETWVAKTRIETIDEEKGYIVVEAPNEFTADWLDSRYRDELEQVVQQVTGTTYSLTFQPLHSQGDTYKERATKVLRAKEEPNILQEMSFELLKMKAEIRMLKNQNEYLMEQNAKLEKMMQDSYVSKGELHRILKEHGINQKNEGNSLGVKG